MFDIDTDHSIEKSAVFAALFIFRIAFHVASAKYPEPVSYTHLVYHKHYDDVLILLKTGLRISELCGLTVADIDFKNEVVIIWLFLQSKEQWTYPKIPLQRARRL